MFVKYSTGWHSSAKFEYSNLFGEYFTDSKICYILYTVYIQGEQISMEFIFDPKKW